MPSVLIIEEDLTVGSLMAASLFNHGWRPLLAQDAQHAAQLAAGREPDLILLSVEVKQAGPADLIEALADAAPDAPLVLVSGPEAWAETFEDIQSGRFLAEYQQLSMRGVRVGVDPVLAATWPSQPPQTVAPCNT